MKQMIIRPLSADETELLKDFLYEAIFIPEGVEAPDKSIINQPELSLYCEDFGSGPADHCLVAEIEGKVVGGIYDDRFLVKPTKSATALMPNAEMELPYDGVKEMLLVDNVEREYLEELLNAVYEELPASKGKKKS